MRLVKSLLATGSLAVMLFGASMSKVDAAYEFTFKVHNNTESKITKLLASEDGQNFGFFDIGNGIAPGGAASLVWDKSTDESNCEWYFKAVYADGSESPAAAIDFCEGDLELEFSE